MLSVKLFNNNSSRINQVNGENNEELNEYLQESDYIVKKDLFLDKKAHFERIITLNPL